MFLDPLINRGTSVLLHSITLGQPQDRQHLSGVYAGKVQRCRLDSQRISTPYTGCFALLGNRTFCHVNRGSSKYLKPYLQFCRLLRKGETTCNCSSDLSYIHPVPVGI